MKLRARLRALFVAHAPRMSARVLTLDDRELGRLGEELVARELRRRGARILARRLRTPIGEVDVLALDARGLVCAEVKSGRREPVPRPRGVILPDTFFARFRPAARVGERSRDRLEHLARSIGKARGLAARVEIWEVVLHLDRRLIEVVRVDPP